MSAYDDDSQGIVVAFVSGALVGAFATLLFMRAQRNRAIGSRDHDDDYRYDGGDLFV